MAVCKFCGAKIIWLKEGRRNIPVSEEGERHSCDEMKKSLGSVKTFDRSQLSDEEIKKYESQINSRRKK